MPEPREYWDVRFSQSTSIGVAEACEELRRRLDESVRLRMISEVPLGAFLSGGVDSSAVVATMAELSDSSGQHLLDRVRGSGVRRVALRAAGRRSLPHALTTSDLVESDDFDLIDTLARLYDEPYADSSAIPTYRVCQLARKHVTVALSGDGGDESFGGYRRYRLHLAEERLRAAMPLGLRRSLFGLLGRAYPKLDWAPRMFRAKTTFEALARNSVEAYFNSVSCLRDPHALAALQPDACAPTLGGYRRARGVRPPRAAGRHRRSAGADPVPRPQDLPGRRHQHQGRPREHGAFAGGARAADGPRAGRVAGDRCPRTSRSAAAKASSCSRRAWRAAFRDEIMYRPKMGFSVPLARWFRGPLRERVRGTLGGGALVESGLFNPRTLQRIGDEHRSGIRDHSTPIWTLLMFEAFLRNVMSGEAAPQPLHEAA